MDPPFFLIGGYVCANLLSLGLFAVDKSAAVTGSHRFPEQSLLLAAAAGPFGALAAMAGFRHKTRHRKFLLLVPLLATVHLLGILRVSGTI